MGGREGRLELPSVMPFRWTQYGSPHDSWSAVVNTRQQLHGKGWAVWKYQPCHPRGASPRGPLSRCVWGGGRSIRSTPLQVCEARAPHTVRGEGKHLVSSRTRGRLSFELAPAVVSLRSLGSASVPLHAQVGHGGSNAVASYSPVTTCVTGSTRVDRGGAFGVTKRPAR